MHSPRPLLQFTPLLHGKLTSNPLSYLAAIHLYGLYGNRMKINSLPLDNGRSCIPIISFFYSSYN